MKNNYIIIISTLIGLIILVILVWSISAQSFPRPNQPLPDNYNPTPAPIDVSIKNFDECAAAGNAVLESYPRQCRANGQVFQEEVPTNNMPISSSADKTHSLMSEAEARSIAEKNCIKGGDSLGSGFYNEGTRTWWFDANLNSTKPGCHPACVVSEETKTAEINWRCTGLIAPE